MAINTLAVIMLCVTLLLKSPFCRKGYMSEDKAFLIMRENI